MSVEAHLPPPARLGGRQLLLPLVPPVAPPPAPPPVPDAVVPRQVWLHLTPPAQAHVRQTFIRILQEVLRDDVER